MILTYTCNIKLGKKTVTKLTYTPRSLGSTISVETDDGYTAEWLLADAPLVLRNFVKTAKHA